jgi:phospholipase D1/2
VAPAILSEVTRPLVLGLLGLALVGLSLAWRYTALGALIQPDVLIARGEALRESAWALAAAPLVFIGLAVVMVPVTLLRVTSVIVFGPLWGPLFALVGSAVAALVGFEVGRHAGGPFFARFTGPRVQRIRERVHGGGALAVVALRLVPLGPFMVVNAACGAAGIQRRPFMVGTVIVMVPTLVLMALAVTWFPALAGWVMGR